MTKKIIKIKNSGFVLLFAVTLAAILLAIALGVSNVAFRELKFSTSAKDSNDAFFAADSGAEKVLFQDRSDANPKLCNGVTCDPVPPIYGLGANSTSCAQVTIKKFIDTDGILKTTVVSKGHNKTVGTVNNGCSSDSTTVERQLEINY